MTTALDAPRRLVEHNAEQLARFGYVPFGGAEPDWDSMWVLLKGDFATLARPDVPDYGELSPWPREAARIYMRRRLIADRLFEECRGRYDALHAQGIDTELVEAYSLARDAYEESVFDFGRARERLEEVLSVRVDARQPG